MAKRTTKKSSIKDDILALLLKNAENDPEAAELLKAINSNNTKVSQPQQKRTTKKTTTQTRLDDSSGPKKNKVSPRIRSLQIGKNTFDPKKFAKTGHDAGDKLLKKQKVITTSEREAFEPVRAVCSACGNIEYVSPELATGNYYRCGRCVPR